MFNKSFLPDVSLNFTLPSYNRSISNILQPDGTYAFRESNNANSRLNLSISQKVPFTGGEISITNSFNRLDLFGVLQNSTSYSASWFGINLSQPLNFFNSMKWDKKIQEAKLEYNNLKYIRENIEVKKKVINLYFELLTIKNGKDIIAKRIVVANKYKNIVEKLIVAGRLMAYDSIDAELNLLNAKKKFNFINKFENFKTENTNTFLNSEFLKKQDILEIPKVIFEISELDVYISRYLEVYPIIERNSLLSFEKTIKQLEKNRFYTANLSLGVGFNNTTSNDYENIFQDPNQSQNFSISLNVPLLDFGKKRIQLEVTKSQYEIQTSNLEQEKAQTIEYITFLYAEISDLISSYEIEEARFKLLEIKQNKMKTLLYAQKVLLKDYSVVEDELYKSMSDKINIIRNIYNKIIELEEITFLEII